MTPRKFIIAFAHYPYGGNGGTAAEVPHVRHWKERMIPWLLKDPRIEAYFSKDFTDTPIPMTRNQSVLWARSVKADFLVMVDSDMWPDRYLFGRDPNVKSFLESSFDHAYKLWDKEKLCIFAPYCGPPPEELPYVFEWRTYMGEQKDDLVKLEMLTREQAARMGGFHRVAAGPTGLMMTDMRLFAVTDPMKIKEILGVDELANKGWFYYEYTDDYGSEKASTEDVTFTRELSQVGLTELGYNPVVCNFDAWAAHMKPKAVGKPMLLLADSVNERLVAAVKRQEKAGFKERMIDYTDQPGLVIPDNLEVVEFDPSEPTPEFADDGRKIVRYSTENRTIGGYEVTSLGFQTPMSDLAAVAEAFREKCAAHTPRSLRRMNVVEIGSWVGESAVAMASVGRTVDRASFHIWCVDPHQPFDDKTTFDLFGEIKPAQVKELFAKNTQEFPEIELYPATSLEAAERWFKGRKIDFLFIDGAHSREALVSDIDAWSPYLTTEATLVFHDYKAVGFPGVTEVIHETYGEDIVYHPRGTNIAIVKMADIIKRRKKLMKGKNKSCGPAKAASPPKGGPAQKTSPPKGGPAKGRRK